MHRPNRGKNQPSGISLEIPARMFRSRAIARSGPVHLLKSWARVAPRLRTATHLALLLDFDGTLVPLRHRATSVRLDEILRQLLRRLANHPRVSVTIISGRRRADLRRRVNLPGLHYQGLHGWERVPGRTPAGAARTLVRRAKRVLTRSLLKLPGISVEDKGFGLVVHYRSAPRTKIHQARRLVHKLVESFAGALWMLEAKKSWEILPRGVHGKGVAVKATLARLPPGALPIYVGDDSADEEAFAALRRGLTVRVGPLGPTKARFHLRHPAEVRRFLQRLEVEIH